MICSPRQMKANEMGWACSTYGESIWAYRTLVGRPEGQRPLERPRRILEDNIKTNLQKVGRRAWTGLMWLRTETGGGSVNVVIRLRGQ